MVLYLLSRTLAAEPHPQGQLKNHPKVVCRILVARGGIEPGPRMPDSTYC
jgi:hypothetical protein